jgi:hypothetical protein
VAPVSVAGIAASTGAVAAGVAGASPHSSPVPALPLLRPLAATIARISQIGPELMAPVVFTPPTPSAPTTAPRVVTPPTPAPTAEPHTPAISPPASDVSSVAQWTTADITPHPEFDAAPATESGGPSKVTGRGRKKFVSKKQWRWAFANHKPWADGWAKKTPGGPHVRYRVLPTRKGPPTATTVR